MKTTLLFLFFFLVIGFAKAEEPSVHRVTSSGYNYDLHSIERLEDGTLVCKLRVIRTHVHVDQHQPGLILLRADRRGTTRLVDENGKEYVPESIRVNDKRKRYETFIGLGADLNTPVRLEFNVPGVDPDISAITLFEVAFSDRQHGHDGEFVVRFRDVKIQ